ncbi:MAG TPA: ion transporter [Candidatus Stackebrandtia excrementipullorum]|nr:ion transporter [Candidatus Stackebrandtia excrementipullorum]
MPVETPTADTPVQTPTTPTPPQTPSGPVSAWCHRVAEARGFQLLSTGVIVFNAVLIGVETYQHMIDRFGWLLRILDELCLAFFVIELVIRLTAFGVRPWRFFRSGWNCFDFAVVAAGLLPGLRENVTLLRLIRLARIVRLVRVFPSLRVLLTAVVRSFPGAVGLVMVGVVVLYLYGVLGWILFGRAMPDEYGTIGEAVLTLFFLLTMDNVGATVREGIDVTALALPYYVSFILFGAFVLINLLIGVVITSMEEARALEDEARQATEPGSVPTERETVDLVEVQAKILELQALVSRLDPSPPEIRQRDPREK